MRGRLTFFEMGREKRGKKPERRSGERVGESEGKRGGQSVGTNFILRKKFHAPVYHKFSSVDTQTHTHTRMDSSTPSLATHAHPFDCKLTL